MVWQSYHQLVYILTHTPGFRRKLIQLKNSSACSGFCQNGHGFVVAAPLRAEPVIAGVLSQSDTQRVSLAPALCKLYIIGTPSPK